MKELEIAIIKELIPLYRAYLRGEDETYLRKKAKELYDRCVAHTLVHESVFSAFGPLFPIGYPDVPSGIKPPSKEEAKKIIETLQKRKKELENQS
ncbi:hypothetical protein HZB03_01950 [Candidatus Woesearchaeota archaeon]|nr:hypothetical protein [Candidatus Woesearchaeota archaeon]